MKRIEVFLTEEQNRRLDELASDRGTSKASVLRWALGTALGIGDREAEARAIILATAGVCADYPDWPEVATTGAWTDRSRARRGA